MKNKRLEMNFYYIYYYGKTNFVQPFNCYINLHYFNR